jgi:hypothetical protein
MFTEICVRHAERSCFRHCGKSRKVEGSIPDEVIAFFDWPKPSSRTMALGLTQPLTEMSTRNPHGAKKAWPARKTDNLTAICEPIVYRMWSSTWGTRTHGGMRRYLRDLAKASYVNQNETQELLEPWTSFDFQFHEDSSPNSGVGTPDTSSLTSLTGQNHINNW